MDFWAKMGSVPLNSSEPARPADTNAAPVVRLHAYLFATSSVRFQNVPEIQMLNISTFQIVRLSSPAVQQLWTLYPGKQTANLFPNRSWGKNCIIPIDATTFKYLEGKTSLSYEPVYSDGEAR
ncbi:hypothetical protein Tco_1063864 [Tanacetum coccineum]